MSYCLHVTLDDDTRVVHFFVRPDRRVRPRKKQLNDLCMILTYRFGEKIAAVAHHNKNGVEVKIRNDQELRRVVEGSASDVRLFALRGQKRVVIDDSDSETDDELIAKTPDKVVDLGFTRGLPLSCTGSNLSL